MVVRGLLVAVLGCLAAGCGVTGNFRHDPGYASFGSLHRLDSDDRFALSLGPLPLRLARWVLDEEDEAELEPLLKELKGVRVYTLEGLRSPEDLAGEADKVTRDLQADGWINVVTVREDDELTAVLLRPGNRGQNRGLAVIVQEPDEVVLVNLIGHVRLDLFADYMAELDVDVPAVEIDPVTLQARAQAH